MTQKLVGIPETLLIPLWAKAAETQKSDSIIKDECAVKIVDQIDYDFNKFKDAWRSQLGVAIRTHIFDTQVKKFLNKNPEAVIINLGAGLDTRYSRLSPKNIYWYDLDVPESIEMRKKFFKETDHNQFIAKSMFDLSWIQNIKQKNLPILIIAEGLFMYFEEEKLADFMNKLADHFPKSEFLIEVIAPFLVGKSKHHDSVKHIDSKAEFQWGISDSRNMAHWHSNLKFKKEWDFFDYYKLRWGLVSLFSWIPAFKRNFSSRIVHLSA